MLVLNLGTLKEEWAWSLFGKLAFLPLIKGAEPLERPRGCFLGCEIYFNGSNEDHIDLVMNSVNTMESVCKMNSCDK